MNQNKKYIVFAVVLLIISAIMICCKPNPPKGSLFQQAKLGQELYLTHCARCHGPDAQGMVIDSTGEKSADLSTIQKKERS